MIEESEWKRAAEVLLASKEVVVACHVAPDGDALGSMLGLAGFLRRLGKRVWTSWGAEAVQVPVQYGWLPGADLIVDPTQVPENPKTFVAIDCGDIKRLELLEPKFEKAEQNINIDHHISNDRFAEINLVDPDAASSCELAYELTKRMGSRIDKDEATCFYTGIVTDTGRFQYNAASPTTLRTAAELREFGIEHSRIAQDVFESSSFDYLHVLGLVLSRAKLQDGLVWSWLDQKDLGEVGLDETEDFIDVLRSVRESRVALMFKQVPDGSYKVSMRSKGEVDVAKVAQHFGGGGHERAAGFQMGGSIEQALTKIKARLLQSGSAGP